MKHIQHPKRKIIAMPPRKPIYEGKAKQLFEGPEPGTLIQHFKDDATAFNNVKKGTISGKGVLNNRISEYLMLRIQEMGIPTHFIRSLNMREQLIKSVQIVPLEIIIRNYAAGSFAKRFGVKEGKALGHPLIEYCYKKDELGDPFVTEEHIFAFGWASPQEIDEIRMYSFRINDFLSGLFMGVGIRLVDFKLEFGRLFENERESLVLADEISPDNCRLWDMKTGHKLDKDRFRQDLGKVEDAYREVARRLGVLPQEAEASYVINVGAKVATRKPAKKKAKEEMKAKIHITLKNGVLDPQGRAIAGALHNMGFPQVEDVRQGKYIEVEVKESDRKKAEAAVEKMCAGLLANTVVENYRFELE